MSGGRGEFFCEERGETDVFAGSALALASASVFNQFLDCEQSLFGQSRLSSAGLERAN